MELNLNKQTIFLLLVLIESQHIVAEPTCRFNCPNGKPVLKPDKQPEINGCGTHAINFRFEKINMAEFDECCNAHDICYESCHVSKKQCDEEFEYCLNGVCNQFFMNEYWGLLKTPCAISADILVFLVDNFGCESYLNAQNSSCHCV